jgi:Na+-transporting NADH:ubiquinone oxidoreductase subunit NqrD
MNALAASAYAAPTALEDAFVFQFSVNFVTAFTNAGSV